MIMLNKLNSLLRIIYTILLFFLTPFILLRLLWRARRVSAYAQRWSERFGFAATVQGPMDVWFHAVSLGEVNVIAPLVKALQVDYPEKRILITTGTPTGSLRVKQLFAETVSHTYVPFDYPFAVKRFLKQMRPKVLIIAETEIWPNMYFYCARNKVPIILVNARLSERSARGYQRILPLIRETLSKVTLILAQSAADAARFEHLGTPSSRVKVAGNIKFDFNPGQELVAKANTWMTRWGNHRPVWIAASTHPGEEEMILKAFQEIKRMHSDALLILVPRHPERSPEIMSLIKAMKFQGVLRSVDQEINAAMEVLLVNTLGELMLWYHCAQVAFVGGSLIPQGGHNVLEPAALGLPVLTGPQMFNFMEIYRLLQEAHGIITVRNEQELAQQVAALLNDSALRESFGERARSLMLQHRGVTAKQLQEIVPFI